MSDNFKRRQQIIQIVYIAASLLLLGKAFQLQVFDRGYRTDADATAISENVILPARGVIFDRNDSLLVFNKPIYDLMVTYNMVDRGMDTAKFCQLLKITKETFLQNINKDWKNPMYSKSVPFVFLNKLSIKTFARFQESMYEFPGFFIKLRSARGYDHANAANILGYIREVNREEIEQSREDVKTNPDTYVYQPGDYIGDSGLEKQYESLLRGKKGMQLVLKDNLGREVDKYNNGDLDKEAQAGSDLYTTIDLPLQRYAEELMQNKRGGIVAIEPKTGEILALVSTPTYDPNLLTMSEERGEAFTALGQDPNLPFFDRSVMAVYPPGSLFKTVVALIGLQEGVLTPNRGIGCSGGYVFQGSVLTGCHNHVYCSSLPMAVQHSCNSYFVTVFKDIIDKEGIYNPSAGLDRFNYYLNQFGLGQKLGIDFPREQTGFYPDSDFYTNNLYKDENGKWRSIWIRSLGIGQGELLMTTLQMANVAAIIANRGSYITPHLVTHISDGYGKKKSLNWEETAKKVEINQEYFDPVINGMEGAVNAGTATAARIPGVPFCGKTGTAENNQRSKKDHSIFFGFGPKENPQIAIAVFVENAGWGGSFAAPIASLIAEKYINKEITDPNRLYLEKRMLDAVLIESPLVKN